MLRQGSRNKKEKELKGVAKRSKTKAAKEDSPTGDKPPTKIKGAYI